MEKHIMVTGTSKVSWKDAIVQTIAEASKTILFNWCYCRKSKSKNQW